MSKYRYCGVGVIVFLIISACSIPFLGTPSGRKPPQQDQNFFPTPTEEMVGPVLLTVDLSSAPAELPPDVPEHLYYAGQGGPDSCFHSDDYLPVMTDLDAREESALEGDYQFCYCDDTFSLLTGNEWAILTPPSGQAVELPGQFADSCVYFTYNVSQSWEYGIYTFETSIGGQPWVITFIPILGYVFDVFQPNETVRLLFFDVVDSWDAYYLGEQVVQADDGGVIRVKSDSIPNVDIVVAIGRQSGVYHLDALSLRLDLTIYPQPGVFLYDYNDNQLFSDIP